jgi:ankyrin repeat protein
MKLYILSILFAFSLSMGQRTALGQPEQRAEGIDQALLDAVEKGDRPKVAKLLKRGANPNARGMNLTVLETAFRHLHPVGEPRSTRHPDIEMVRLLLAKGAKIKRGDLADLASSAGREAQLVEIAKLLLEKGVDLRASGDKALSAAAKSGRVKIVRLLLEKGVSPNGKGAGKEPSASKKRPGTRDDDDEDDIHYADDSDTPLINAVSGDSLDAVQVLLDAGADIKLTNDKGETALIIAARPEYQRDLSTRLRVIRLLLSRGADIRTADKEGKTALHYAVDQYFSEAGGVISRPEIVQTFLENGADVNARDKRGNTALILTMRQGWVPPGTDDDQLKIVNLLLDKHADIDAHDDDGLTPLMIASEMGRNKLLSILLEKGAEIDAKDVHGDTALVHAVESGKEETVRLLREKGADPKATHYQSDAAITVATKNYALIKAAFPGSLEQTKAALDSGADVNARDSNGATPLLLAAAGYASEKDKIVLLLLEKGADPNALDNTGFSPLMVAAYYTSDVVKSLLDHHAEVNLKNKEQKTALLIASEGGHTKIASLLLARGADAGCRDETGKTALMLAADSLNVQAELIELLMAKGLDPNATDNEGNTPMILAARSRGWNAIETLLAHGAQVNAKNKEGRSALSYWKENESKWPNESAYAMTLLKKAGARD